MIFTPRCARSQPTTVAASRRGEHLDRTMRLQVEQQRAVAVAFFPGEIVEAQHLWGLALGNIRAVDEPQERIAASGHREALRQLRTCFARLSQTRPPEGASACRSVRRAYARVNVGKRFAKVVRGQPRVRHTKRRTSRR